MEEDSDDIEDKDCPEHSRFDEDKSQSCEKKDIVLQYVDLVRSWNEHAE